MSEFNSKDNPKQAQAIKRIIAVVLSILYQFDSLNNQSRYFYLNTHPQKIPYDFVCLSAANDCFLVKE
ncbi:hypothetical protein [uncultured Shewanella sp.]|uniref:hypothetical protein n=1 Tax=uncultured Shewanella sp. TaxID=173975 RepID=UPI002614656A|nr:hypothetical protein [uncultured Shewanella sp.]